MTEYIKSMRKYIGHERLLIVGASVFVHKDGKLLMQKRKDNGCWAGDHGGCCELGETVEETAKRELLEETGLTANKLELVGIFSGKELLYTYPNGDKVSNVNIAYLCEDFSGEPLEQTDETTDLKWFALDEIPENISPPTIPALSRCLEVLRERYKPRVNHVIIPNALSNIRLMTINDYDKIYSLWLSTPNMGLNDIDDSEEGIAKYLARNPNTCFVAEKDGELVGVIMSGHDGRRGYIHHTAVKETSQRQGVGDALVNAALSALEREGIKKVALVVYVKNDKGNAFWEKQGFTTRPDLVYRNRALADLRIIDT